MDIVKTGLMVVSQTALRLIPVALAIFCCITAVPSISYAQQETSNSGAQTSDTTDTKTYEMTFRWGGGGFSDDRAEGGDLGGGQASIEISRVNWPVLLSFSAEYYTDSRDPTNSYEIKQLLSLSVFYTDHLLNFERAKYYAGGGVGKLRVPFSEQASGGTLDDTAFSVEAGLKVAIWRGLGLYGAWKYLSADKNVNDVKVIDYSETIFLFGLTYSFQFL